MLIIQYIIIRLLYSLKSCSIASNILFFIEYLLRIISISFKPELSKKLLPEQPSHSLGKLVRALGIPMADRHRASGDAMATVKLFKMLLDKDLEKTIVKILTHFE